MWPFKKRERSSVALFDIGSGSVGGALAYAEKGKPVALCYAVRTPLGKGTDGIEGMVRALTQTGDRLVREGAPVLRAASGSGSIDRILVNIGSPWQETGIRNISRAPKKPFTFSKGIEEEMLAQEGLPDTGKTAEQIVVATLLNGYLTREPYGKRANRVELVELSSSLDQEATSAVEGALRPLFHTRAFTYTSFPQASFDVLCRMYPHEPEFLVLSVTGAATEVVSVKRGHLRDVGTLKLGTDSLVAAVEAASRQAHASGPRTETPAGYIRPERNAKFGEEAQKAEAEWRQSLETLMREFAIRHALPRTVFLFAENEARGFLSQTLHDPSLRALWLSDEPITVVPLLPKHFSGHVKTVSADGGDAMLALLALHYQSLAAS